MKFLTVFAIIFFISACAGGETDAERFREEHEMFNGQVTRDGENYHMHMDIPRRNPFVYVDGAQVYEMLTAGSGSGIIYMGFPECPWCRTLIPSLLDALGEAGFRGNVYYYNGLADRDILRLDDYGEIEVVQEGEPIYHQLVALLFDYLGKYVGLGDESIRRIYFPTTVFFRDGEITSVHLGTVPSHVRGFDALSEDELDELKTALVSQIREIQ